jgi:hypothetical protein
MTKPKAATKKKKKVPVKKKETKQEKDLRELEEKLEEFANDPVCRVREEQPNKHDIN